MQRTETPVELPKQDAEARTPAAASGLRLIDPSDFKFIGGGAPRGGWPAAESLVEDPLSAPRGGW